MGAGRERQVAEVGQGEQHAGGGAGDPGEAFLGQGYQIGEGDDGGEDEGELQAVEDAQGCAVRRLVGGRVRLRGCGGRAAGARAEGGVGFGGGPGLGRGPGRCLRPGASRFRQQGEEHRGGERQYGHQQVLPVRVDPWREYADQDRRGHQGGPRAALHQGERPGQPGAVEGGGEVAVGRGEGAAEEALEHQREGEGGQRVGGPGQQEGDGEAELGAQQESLAAVPVGEPPPHRGAEGAEHGGHDVQHARPASLLVAESGQDRGQVGRQAEGGEGGDEVAGGDGVHLTSAESVRCGGVVFGRPGQRVDGHCAGPGWFAERCCGSR